MVAGNRQLLISEQPQLMTSSELLGIKLQNRISGSVFHLFLFDNSEALVPAIKKDTAL